MSTVLTKPVPAANWQMNLTNSRAGYNVMHENVLRTKNELLDKIKKSQASWRSFHLQYADCIEKFHCHEMNEQELSDFKEEWIQLVNQLFPPRSDQPA